MLPVADRYGTSDCGHPMDHANYGMLMISRKLAAALFAVVMALPGSVVHGHSDESHGPIESLGPFSDWLRGLRLEARASGISEATLDSALKGIKRLPRVIELDRSQPEFTLTFAEYFKNVAPHDRIRRGRQRLSRNRAVLDSVSADYGVPVEIIVALWAMETDFGRLTGGFQVIPALATLAHDGRRSDYFRAELLSALKIIDEGHITAAGMKGSWAGAMGQPQFMPSSFLNSAVDRNSDGRKDIWSTREDVFASAANLMRTNGWRRGQRWGRPVMLPPVFDLGVEGIENKKILAIWQAMGIRNRDGSDLPVNDTLASLIMPDGPDGPVFLVYENYLAIMQWNRSHYFALSVGYLADQIAENSSVIY